MKKFYFLILSVFLAVFVINTQTTHTINTGSFYYTPSTLTINVGDSYRRNSKSRFMNYSRNPKGNF